MMGVDDSALGAVRCAACKADKPNKPTAKSVDEIKALTGTDPILSVKTGEGIRACNQK